ncbi:MAG: hypothetical protein U9R53_10490 [Chloroflexota bacterium]|nr:hypothetical protein [Chloroflexota bacterium]
MLNITKKHSFLIIIVVLILATISCNLFNQLGSEPESDEALEDGQVQEDASKELDGSDIVEGSEDASEASESQEEEPVEPSASEVGLSRENPIPLGRMISVPGWDIQVLEFLRGEAAEAVVNGGDRKFDPPPEGYEYALAKVFLRCTNMDGNAHSIGINEMYITGSSHIRFGDWMDGWPAPEFLYEDMFTAEVVEGWIDARIPITEENLMLVYDADPYEEPRITRYYELEDGASITPSGALFEQTPNDVGVTMDQPASIGELMVMPCWDITVLSSMRGEEALSSLKQDSPNYSGPEEGDEYALIEVLIHYFGQEDLPISVYDGNFYTEVDGSTHRGRIRYPMQSDFTWINSVVFPGATLEGWMIVSLPEGITNLVIAFNPGVFTSNRDQTGEFVRYFTIP